MAATRLVDGMIVGAQKAGTSSLAHYLGQHPSICTHRRREFSYFVDEDDYARGYADSQARYFGSCPPGTVLLAKSVTVMTEPRLVERARRHNAAMRLIVVLRDPVERAYSAYWWARQYGYETLGTFEDALDADPARHHGRVAAIRSTSYLAFGDYTPQIKNLFAQFGRDQVQVHLFDDLTADPALVCRRSFEALGVDPAFVPNISQRRNPSSRARSQYLSKVVFGRSAIKRRLRRLLPAGATESWKRRIEHWNRASFEQPPMAPDTRRRLARHFAPMNAQLAELIGRDLSQWGGGAA